MTEERMALVELLQKADDGDFLRAVAEAVLQLLMEADVDGVIGAGRHERSPERLNYRNGHRPPTATSSFCLSEAILSLLYSTGFYPGPFSNTQPSATV